MRKHGIDFQDAARLFETPTLDRLDHRRDYGEVRTNSIGWIDGLHVVNVTHTGRDGRIRLISARPATSLERAALSNSNRANRTLARSQPNTTAPATISVPIRPDTYANVRGGPEPRT